MKRGFTFSPSDPGSLTRLHFGIPITGGIAGGPVVFNNPRSGSKRERATIWDMRHGGLSNIRFGNTGTIPGGIITPP